MIKSSWFKLINKINKLITIKKPTGSQEVNQEGDRQHLRLHRQGHRTPRRPGNPAQQPKGAGAAEQGVHHRCHSDRRRDVLPLHSSPRPDERVPRAGAQRAERSFEGALVPVRVHRRGSNLFV